MPSNGIRTPWFRLAVGIGGAGVLVMLEQVHQAETAFFVPLYVALLLSVLIAGRYAMATAIVGTTGLFLITMYDFMQRYEATTLILFILFGNLAFVMAELRVQAVKLQRNLRSSEEKYRQLVEKALAGIFLYRDDRILYSNNRFMEMLGYKADDVIGRPFWGFVHEEDEPKIRELLSQRQAGVAVDLHYECRLRAKDGRIIWVEIVSSPADYDGKPAVLVSSYNITSRKLIEEQRKELSKLAEKQEEQLVHSTRLAEMGEMAAGVAHELNQPLTGIKNFARNASYMLEQGAGDMDEVKENLRLISGQVDRASKIINQMRELARRTERHVGPVDINNTLRESAEFVMPQLKLSGVEVVFALDAALPQVLGDRIRLEQVFLNLLTNARHAMEEVPERRLEVRTRHEPNAPRPVVVEIADTGKGFSSEVAERLFTPFFSTKKASHGTGLGLSISLGIVKDHKGVIEAAGAEGRGATFTVRLPLGEAGARMSDEG